MGDTSYEEGIRNKDPYSMVEVSRIPLSSQGSGSKEDTFSSSWPGKEAFEDQLEGT